jgi:uncharacterized membrane protein
MNAGPGTLASLGLAAQLEWRMSLGRRRTLLLGAGIPLLLVLPVTFGGAPPFHAAAVFTVLFTLFGTFGSAIPLVRDAETGILKRLALTGTPAGALLTGRVLAAAATDLLQLLPALLILLLAPAATTNFTSLSNIFRNAATLVAALAATLIVANAIGTWVAAAARSIAEAALFAAVTVLFGLHAAGVFRAPAPGSVWERLEPLLPFHPLHQSILQVLGINSTYNLAANWLGPLSATAAALIGTALLAPRLLSSLVRIRGR